MHVTILRSGATKKSGIFAQVKSPTVPLIQKISGELSPEDPEIQELLREYSKRVRESPEFKRGNPSFQFRFDDEEPAAHLHKYHLCELPYDMPHYDSLG